MLSVTAMLDFSGKANTSIHGFGEDDTEKFDNTQKKLKLAFRYPVSQFWIDFYEIL